LIAYRKLYKSKNVKIYDIIIFLYREIEDEIHFESIDIKRELGLRSESAMSLNVASNIYSSLSPLQQTREEKIKSLETSLEYSEEAIKISRRLGLRSELSMSLNNASSGYFDLSYLQNEEEEEEGKNLRTALEYIKEAINIRKELGLGSELSDSLNNASRIYLQLSIHEEKQEQRIILDLANDSMEKVIEIRKDLGFILELADSFAISVPIYDSFLSYFRKQ
jgi:tetratricopeptide (TPR) repeat protein